MGAEKIDVVVELLLDGGPVGHALGDGMRLVDEIEGDGLLPVVRGGLQSEVLEPVIRAGAVAVHGAVEVHGGDAVLVRINDVVNVVHVRLADAGGAFVVDDHVVALRPVGLLIHGEARSGALVFREHDIDHHIRPRLDALAENAVLLHIVMAAAAGHQQDMQGPGFSPGKTRHKKCHESEETEFDHGERRRGL